MSDESSPTAEPAATASAPERPHAASRRAPSEPLAAALAFLLYAGATVLVFWPWVAHLSTELIGPPEDNMQDLWGTWWVQVAMDDEGLDLLHTRAVRFPEGASLLHHSLTYSNSSLIFAVRKALGVGVGVGQTVALHNGALLLSVPFAALGAYLLARHLGAGRWAAIAAGWIFGFSPWHVAMLQHHMHVATCQYVPFFVLFSLRAAERRRPADAAGAVVFHALGALSSWYFLVYGTLFQAFHLAFDSWRARAVAWRTLAMTAAIAACTAVLLSPLLVPMAREALASPRLTETGHDLFVADAAALVTFPPHHLLAQATEPVRALFSGNAWESTAYLGIVNLALLGLGWILFRRRRDPGASFPVAGGVFFTVVAFGGTLHLLGRPLVPAPARLLAHLPLVANARTPVRAIVYVTLFLGVGVALALTAIRRHPSSRPRLRGAVLVAVALLVALDFLPTRLESTLVEAPPAYGVIDADPEAGFGILDLPVGYVAGNRYMMGQLFHRRPIVAATLSRNASPALVDRLDLRDPLVLRRQLTDARVKYVFVHKDGVLGAGAPEWLRARFEAYLAPLRQAFPEVFADDRTVAFKVY
jgi:hypothetical protein